MVEVFCDCARELSPARYAERAATRHAGHFDTARIDDKSMWDGEATRPLDLGWPVISLDTSVPLDVDALLREIGRVANCEP
jgi:hypothetical protein